MNPQTKLHKYILSKNSYKGPLTVIKRVKATIGRHSEVEKRKK